VTTETTDVQATAKKRPPKRYPAHIRKRRLKNALPALEMELASRDFVYFLDKHVYLLERPQPLMGITGGKTKFIMWPHLQEMAQDLLKHRKIVVLKARQEGFSWTLAAYAVWLLRFKKGTNVLMLSQGKVEAANLLAKAIFIYRNMPDDWKLPLGSESKTALSVPNMDSTIMALPSTEKAGRSETATLVIQDEADHHEYLDDDLIALSPTIDAGGQLIMGSTSNKKKMISSFKEIFRRSPNNGWHKIFWSWKLRPGRDGDWYEKTKQSIPETEVLSPELYMQQEYPETEDEALAPARALAAFDQDILQAMYDQDLREPIRTDAGINIYHEKAYGKVYMAATDSAHGVGRDYSVTVILERDTGYVAADFMSNTTDTTEFAYRSMDLLELYGNPIWAIEDNEVGVTVLDAARREKYNRIYKRTTGRKSKLHGWHTDNSNRNGIWSRLRDAIHARMITIPNKAGLSQFFSVIQDPDSGFRFEAMQGAHDDYPMAVAIAWEMGKHAMGSGVGKDARMPAMW
jgi:hypothetical protein